MCIIDEPCKAVRKTRGDYSSCIMLGFELRNTMVREWEIEVTGEDIRRPNDNRKLALLTLGGSSKPPEILGEQSQGILLRSRCLSLIDFMKMRVLRGNSLRRNKQYD